MWGLLHGCLPSNMPARRTNCLAGHAVLSAIATWSALRIPLSCRMIWGRCHSQQSAARVQDKSYCVSILLFLLRATTHTSTIYH
jgi:hypothetical protein